MPFPFSYFQDAPASPSVPPHDRLLRPRRLPPPRGTPAVPEGSLAQEPSPVLGDTRVEHRLTLYVHPHAICTQRGRAETGLRLLPSNLPAVDPLGGLNSWRLFLRICVGIPAKRSAAYVQAMAEYVPVPQISQYSAYI